MASEAGGLVGGRHGQEGWWLWDCASGRGMHSDPFHLITLVRLFASLVL